MRPKARRFFTDIDMNSNEPMRRRVVITGMGAVSPLGIGVEPLWEGLKTGRSGAGPITYFDASQFNSQIAAEVKGFDAVEWVGPKDARTMDPFVAFAMAVAKMAFTDSGIDLEKEDASRCGVVMGTGIGGIRTIEDQKEIYDVRGPRRIRPHFIPALIGNMAAGMISMRFGLQGPNLCVMTACATGNNSIGEAFRLIRSGVADVMIAGGTESAITPLGFGGFAAMKALTTRNDEPERASRPFDVDRDGFLMGEGAGALILETEEHAKARGAEILCEIVGYGLTADAFHMTQPAPEGRGGREAMRLALNDAGIPPESVDYVNSHGTSTPTGDGLEIQAIKTLFGDHAKNGLMVSSTKSMIGHLLGAAGAVESIACILAIREGVVPPTINLDNPSPECDVDLVPHEAREAKVRLAINNSFGFGGHNAVLAFSAYDR